MVNALPANMGMERNPYQRINCVLPGDSTPAERGYRQVTVQVPAGSLQYTGGAPTVFDTCFDFRVPDVNRQRTGRWTGQ
jgi:hypothetical protein